jgi:hypothetical protein
MSSPIPVYISSAVEGQVDEAVVRRVIEFAGGVPGPTYGKTGKDQLRQSLSGFNSSARFRPWVVLTDLDHDAECAPPLRTTLLPALAPWMCLRIVVHEVEAWFLADRQTLARFLSVSPTRIPASPETVDDPKETMVDLARQSRRRDIREDMVPRPGSGRKEGPAYASRLIEFAQRLWQPHAAATHSQSLSGAIDCVRKLVQSYSPGPTD